MIACVGVLRVTLELCRRCIKSLDIILVPVNNYAGRQTLTFFPVAFLRRIKYFSDLLFLTTNRVGQIDDAFISRVHVAIGYDALTPESRSKIWQGFFRKLARERTGKIQISPAAKKWVLEKAISGEPQLNGRDIRNALQTAITLAEAECDEDPKFESDTMTIIVDQSHFQRVMEITSKFHSYVQSIRREDEKKRAAGRYDRNDYWKGEN
ncbi:P-loop containing nucleoside triphosphate hydrolase protein [Apiospora arundinis]